MTAAIPTVQVFLDDGTGTYPTDVSSRVSLSAGIGISGYGRTDEFAQPNAASLNLTLRNDDGGLSSGAVHAGQGIRYKQTKGSTVTRFTGRISELALGWTGGTGKAATVALSAVDVLADLARRLMRSMLEEEILLRDPTAYYTLGEAQGSTTAGDTSGNGNPPLKQAGTGAAVVFGNGTGPVDGLTAATFAGGKWLQQGLGDGTLIVAPSMFGIFAAFNTTTPAGSSGVARVASALGCGIFVRSDGTLAAFGPFSGALATSTAVDDGVTHLVVLTADGNNVWLWVDGTLIGTQVVTTRTQSDLIAVGGAFDESLAFTGTISHFAVFATYLPPTDVANISGIASGTSETTDARLTRLASYAGLTATTCSPSGLLMGCLATSGRSLFDALQEVATAEGGILFANGSGTLTMQGRHYRTLETTPDLTLAVKDVAVSTAITEDTQQIVNHVTAARTDGAGQVAQDTGSIGTYGLFPESLDLAVTDDDDALSAAQWIVAKHATPVRRMGSATVNLLTSSQSATLLSSEIGDRWALSGLPSQTWSGFGDQTVEGWSETLSVTATGAEWTRTVNLLPWALNEALVLDDAAEGLLDTAVLGY
jgi:hypothetical protein